MRRSQFSRSLSIALPSDHFELIKRITDAQEISMAEWVRAAVEMALNADAVKEDHTNE